VGELSRRARAGDRQALEPLVRATYAEAYGVAFRMLGDEHDACDAVQEAYVRVLRGIRRFRGEAGFATWLHRITANCAADVLAGRSRSQHRDLDTLAPQIEEALVDTSGVHDPEARSCQRADRDELVAALADLPERLRVVVVLRDVYDLPHEAIAAELGITVAAAKVRLHRGRRRLREALFPIDGAVSASPRTGREPADLQSWEHGSLPSAGSQTVGRRAVAVSEAVAGELPSCRDPWSASGATRVG